jgi:hypothetical protein
VTATRFRFVVPVRNAQDWIGRSLASIRRQRRRDFTCLVLDDASTDATVSRAREAVGTDERFRVETSPERRFALGNLVHGIPRVSDDPEDVIVLVDGDDWLAHDRVLDVLAEAYARDRTWMTYGSHIRWKGGWRDRLGIRRKRGIAAPIPPGAAPRSLPWTASHLRTFKRFLWDALRDGDLRDDTGGYFRCCYDMAITFPMLEMAGDAHAVYVQDVLYVYNHANPGSVHRVAEPDQILNACRIRLRPAYAPLARRPSSRADPLA